MSSTPPSPPPEGVELLTVPQVAYLLQVSTGTVYGWYAAQRENGGEPPVGGLRFFTLPDMHRNRVRVSRRDLDAWVSEKGI